MAARKAINIRPLWNPALAAVLGYEESAVAAAFGHVWDNYSMNFPGDARLALKREKTAERKALQAGLIVAVAGGGGGGPLSEPFMSAQHAAMLSPQAPGGSGGPLVSPATPLTVASNPMASEELSTGTASTAGLSASGLSVFSAAQAGYGGAGAGVGAGESARALSFSGFGPGGGGGSGGGGGGAEMLVSPAPP